MYEEYGLSKMYFDHLNKRLKETIDQQIQYLKEQTEEKGREEFNIEVAIGEITTAYYANYANAYTPHSPSDYTLSPYQWHETEKYGGSQNTSRTGEVSYNTEAFKYRREDKPTTS
jgi:hypothetical protein